MIPIIDYEMLSNAAAFVRGNEFVAYRQWPSLVEHLLVDSGARRLGLYRRELDCWWLTIAEGGTLPLRLEGIGRDLRVTEAFEDLIT
ncbi:MAG: hypothetical protein KAY97_00905 [Chromatiaceae bacterium]|nr:hypothetical protein [Chromatiaceae bacterium]